MGSICEGIEGIDDDRLIACESLSPVCVDSCLCSEYIEVGMEGDVVVGVVDFGGKGLARLPFGRRSAMLVTAVEAAPGFFFDRDEVVVVVDDAAALLAVVVVVAFFLLLLLMLSPSPLDISSCLLARVLFTEALVSLLPDRKGAAEALLLLLLLLLVFGAAALSRTLLSIDDILGMLLLSIFWLLLRV